MDNSEFQEILSIFKAECDEHLQNLVAGMLCLERAPENSETVEQLFRAAHSLKGASRMVGMEDIEKVAHLLEDLLGDFRKGRVYPATEVIDNLAVFLDRLQKEITARLTGATASLDVASYREEIAAVRTGRNRPPVRFRSRGRRRVPARPSLAGVRGAGGRSRAVTGAASRADRRAAGGRRRGAAPRRADGPIGDHPG